MSFERHTYISSVSSTCLIVGLEISTKFFPRILLLALNERQKRYIVNLSLNRSPWRDYG